MEIAAVGRPRKLPRQLPRNSADFRGDCRVAVAMAADGRGNYHPWQLPRTSVRCHGGTTEFATDRTVVRAVATTVAFAAEVPWAVETRGFPRYPVATPTEVHGSPRKFRSHCRGPPPKSHTMCIRERRAGVQVFGWTKNSFIRQDDKSVRFGK